MTNKKILGLDLGTNSIGWALIEIDHENGVVKVLGLGSRILPMDAGEIGDFESSGKIKSTAAGRTEKRGPRRMNERYMLRRDRLHLVLNLLDALPSHYKLEIDLERNGKKCGQFKKDKEPKIAHVPSNVDSKKKVFLFEDAYGAMLQDMGIENKKGSRVPRDWALYYLRQKALEKEITLEQLAWVLLSYNQKRGYEKLEVEDTSSKSNELREELDLQVKSVKSVTDADGKRFYEIRLSGNDGFVYKEYSEKQMTFENDLKEIVKVSKVDDQGNIDPKKTEFTVIDIYPLSIQNVVHQKEGGKHQFQLTYNNGWEETKVAAKYTFKYRDAGEKLFDYVVETSYDALGNIKKAQGKDRKLREPDFSDNSSDWTLLKKRTEKDALKFNVDQGFLNDDGSAKNYISPKIYSVLKNDAKSGIRTKIIGGLFQVVERKFYREELNQIISTQRSFHAKLNDTEVFERCVKTLYPKNETLADSLLSNKRSIEHLLTEDILLYQRPLKTKKSEIANCKHEIRSWKNAIDKKTGKSIEVVDEETGEISIKKEPVYHKVVSASHPYFQEFRIWDKLHGLKLMQLEKQVNGKLSTNVNVTEEYFTENTYQQLYAKLNKRKTLTHKQFLAFCKTNFKIKDIGNYVWNFPEDEELKGNETRVSFSTRFKRWGFSQSEFDQFLTQEREIELWHYLYSVNYRERKENSNKSLYTFFNRFLDNSEVSDDIKEKVVEDFANYPKFPSNYCAYSEKALKKLLPFIRMGEARFLGKFDISSNDADLKNINYDGTKIAAYLKPTDATLSKEERKSLEMRKQNLHETLWKHSVNERVDEILSRLDKVDFDVERPDFSKVVSDGEGTRYGELPYPKGLFNAFRGFNMANEFTSLDLTRTSYLVYGRHSELAEAKYWDSPEIIRKELHNELKQHSLNNPVAEKVILEMMQMVADIWDYYGEGQEKFFTGIHVEVGRELKKSAKQKKSLASNQKENRAQNKRLRMVLEEFLSTNTYKAKPKSSDHFERLKIVEDSARNQLNKKGYFDDKKYSKKDIENILNKPYIEKQDFDKYKLWIEQGYKSPYTNRIISLTDLFDGAKYNVDHVFPQASVTNDSLSNKVVCETDVNKMKSNQTGREFVNNPKERTFYSDAHKTDRNPKGEITIVDDITYVGIVRSQFSGYKKQILLSKEIPKEFTNSQLNNARHIARKAMELLSHVVREDGEIEFLSKNVLPVTGAVTGKLKSAWRLTEVWKELVAPRYKRLNELTESNLFGQEQISKSGHKYFDCNLNDGIRNKDESYDIKRIDHRHHALDALIIALCTRNHVNYINNFNADTRSKDIGKQKRLEAYRGTLKKKIRFTKKDDTQDDRNWYYMLPGEIRKQGDKTSSIATVLSKSYQYKGFTSFQRDYKEMILTALRHTVVTFKQNLRVINKTVNRYNNTPNKKVFVKQEGEKVGNKYNWAIRRSLGKATFYGKKNLNGEERAVIRKEVDSTFNSTKILTITDTGIQKILTNHLQQFDTLELSFEEAIVHYDALLEKAELESIVKNKKDYGFADINGLIQNLRENEFKKENTDYSKLNVFIEQVPERNFRDDEQFRKKIMEHPEIAFTPEQIEKMNEPKFMQRLNGGKRHTPIRKVRIARGFGKQRRLSENKHSVKFNQYVVNDSGSNLYLGFYERLYVNNDGENVRERKFKGIGLIELIKTLKLDGSNRHHPLPEKIIEGQHEYERKFTLSPLDLVYAPTKEEIEDPSSVDITAFTVEQLERIYKYVDGGGGIANFVPYSISKPIWKFHDNKKKAEIHKELSATGGTQISLDNLIKDEFGFGSQQTKNQNMIDGETSIKKICWKLEVNKLGNITNIVR